MRNAQGMARRRDDIFCVRSPYREPPKEHWWVTSAGETRRERTLRAKHRADPASWAEIPLLELEVERKEGEADWLRAFRATHHVQASKRLANLCCATDFPRDSWMRTVLYRAIVSFGSSIGSVRGFRSCCGKA